MRYIIKSGVLYRESDGKRLAGIRGSLTGPGKQICPEDSGNAWTADIFTPEASGVNRGDVRKKEYVLHDEKGCAAAAGRPGYKEDDDPDKTGWPLARLPRVDHADIRIGDVPFRLTMRSGGNYDLQDYAGESALSIVHRGISGGWNLETEQSFSPELLCGLFVFCRYIEHENEFLTV